MMSPLTAVTARRREPPSAPLQPARRRPEPLTRAGPLRSPRSPRAPPHVLTRKSSSVLGKASKRFSRHRDSMTPRGPEPNPTSGAGLGPAPGPPPAESGAPCPGQLGRAEQGLLLPRGWSGHWQLWRAVELLWAGSGTGSLGEQSSCALGRLRRRQRGKQSVSAE